MGAWRGALLAVLLAPPAWAAPPKAPATVTVRAGEITSFEVLVEPGKELLCAPAFAPEVCYFDEAKPLRADTARFIVSPKAPGTYRVIMATVGEKEFVTVAIDAMGNAPPPRPDPKVGPGPPDPGPDLPAAPDDKARVLMVFDPATLSQQTEARKAVVYGAKTRDYLDATLGQDGYRVYQTDVTFQAGSTSPYKALAGRPRTGGWWVVVTRGGRVVHEGPLPADPDAALALFKKHLGG